MTTEECVRIGHQPARVSSGLLPDYLRIRARAGFGWLLLVLGLAQCFPEQRRLRFAYILSFWPDYLVFRFPGPTFWCAVSTAPGEMDHRHSIIGIPAAKS